MSTPYDPDGYYEIVVWDGHTGHDWLNWLLGSVPYQVRFCKNGIHRTVDWTSTLRQAKRALGRDRMNNVIYTERVGQEIPPQSDIREAASD